jgi:hypothetical protein
LAFAVAVIVALAIIPPVLADTSPIAAPESAAASFWIVGVIANVIVGAMLVSTALLGRRWRVAGQTLAGAAGLAAFVIGMLLLWPAFVFAEHGLGLAGARAAMAISAAGEFAASALALAAAGMLHGFGLAARQVAGEMRFHRRGVALFLAFWLALLVFAAAAWFGVLPGWNQVFWLCALLPLPASFLVGWWQNGVVPEGTSPLAGSMLGGSLVGSLIMVPTIAILISYDAIGTLLSGGAYPLGWEGVEFLVMFGLIGFVQGAVGGLLGAWSSAAWRHWHRHGRPAAPGEVG